MPIKLSRAEARRLGIGNLRKLRRVDRAKEAKTYYPEQFEFCRYHKQIEARLPWPPSMNTYWRRYGSATTVSGDGKAYRDAVVVAWKSCGLTGFGDARLSVSIAMSPPTAARRDLDNFAKCVLDAMTHAGVYGDDSQIDSLFLVRRDPSEGKIIVRIEVE